MTQIAIQETTQRAHDPAEASALRRIAVASLIGATIEWYDFFLYGVVAGIVFNKLFFPTSDPVIGTLLAYVTFAIGFVARPLGGVIFGHFGDRVGRKQMLVLTLVIMGLATFLIGLIPSYATIGVAAPILLLVVRIAQGVGIGGEWGGSVLMIFEHAPQGRRGLYASLPQIGLSIGLCLASGVTALLSAGLGEVDFLSFGWRIAFWLSAGLVAVGLYIRIRVLETPEFAALRAKGEPARAPFVEMLKGHWVEAALGMGARYIDGVFFNVFGVYAIAYLTQQLKLPRTEALLGVTAAALVMCAFIPLFGALSDRYGRTRVYFWGSLATGLSALPAVALWLAAPGEPALVWAGLIVPLGILYASIYGPEAAMFAELFPVGVRYSGISFVYQFSGIFASGLTPIFATALTEAYGPKSAWPIAGYCLFAGIVSAASAAAIGRRARKNFPRSPTA
jgi:MHS family shikimate/dehydroshikimate transporter-like MFS transporter